MKKSVLDISDLQKVSSFFKNRLGIFLGNKMIKWLCVDKVNMVHANNCHLRGSEFTSALLKEPVINLAYEVHNAAYLDAMPEGAFVTVSNHPVGSLDGIILIDIFAARRPDFRVMVNGVLSLIGAMEDNFISVLPDSKSQGPNLQNVNGVRASLAHLAEGHPMGFFPSGAISFYNKKIKGVCDQSWAHSVIRLIRKANVPVYPVYFDISNSKFFYLLGLLSWRIRSLRIPAEVFNKRGKVAHIYIGEPVPAEEIRAVADDKKLAELLYQRTYNAKK
jgi:putative hemolysin